jgi:hypothetical protein
MDKSKIIIFTFQVNKSFKDTNVITIPINCYKQLESDGFVSMNRTQRNNIKITCEKYNRTLNGHIYYYPSKPKHTSYYQIKMDTDQTTDYYGYLKKLEVILVVMKKTSKSVEVNLIDNIEERLKQL